MLLFKKPKKPLSGLLSWNTLIILPGIVFFLASCNHVETNIVDDVPLIPEFTYFESVKYGFSIDIPRGFLMEGNAGKLTSWSYRPGEEELEGFGAVLPRISVTIYDIPKRYRTASLYENKLSNLNYEMEDPDSNLSNLNFLEVEGGYIITYHVMDRKDAQAVNHWFYCIYTKNRYYILDISGTYDQIKRLKPIFDHVFKSFTLY